MKKPWIILAWSIKYSQVRKRKPRLIPRFFILLFQPQKVLQNDEVTSV